ncbi:MAG: large conductance mechanosensitive channel protein MscL [Chthoniobacterales bacterium]|nr:large conductance mechanosensitive channel protein MscL [Chthoniobacterales bacterium]
MIQEPKKVVESSTRFFGEFKEFISRGNVVDLAIGVIMGAAFGKIVTALVSDIMMPPIGLVLKGIDFKDLYLPLNGKHYATFADAQKDGAAILAYGSFINTVIEFVIISACVFALVKAINTLKRSEAAEVTPTKTEELLTEIRDSLKK